MKYIVHFGSNKLRVQIKRKKGKQQTRELVRQRTTKNGEQDAGETEYNRDDISRMGVTIGVIKDHALDGRERSRGHS